MNQTSLQAYKSVQGGTVAAHEQLIMKALEKGPANAYQISLRCSLNKYQVGKRTGKMIEDGKIVPTGKQDVTDTNRQADVYELVKTGGV
jgi:hypothetical protein